MAGTEPGAGVDLGASCRSRARGQHSQRWDPGDRSCQIHRQSSGQHLGGFRPPTCVVSHPSLLVYYLLHPGDFPTRVSPGGAS